MPQTQLVSRTDLRRGSSIGVRGTGCGVRSMTRRAEWASIVAASALAAFGVTLVNFANGGGLDVHSGLTFIIFVLAFGGLSVAVHLWAPKATPLLVPIVAGLAAIGFFQVYRLSVTRAGLQRWWLLIGAALASLVLWLLANHGTSVLRRYRNLILTISIGLLLLPT